MNRFVYYSVISFFVVTGIMSAVPSSLCAAEKSDSLPDTLTVFDIQTANSRDIPGTWEHILPRANRAYTNYSIEERSGQRYLRAMSSGTGSWLEMDMKDLDPEVYPILEWEWMVNQFPVTTWEMNKKNDDFAIRIEFVYDIKGSRWNILNMMRKGLITSFFKNYPPELIISYVWSLNVPAGKPYQSPSAKNTMIVPIESDVAMQGRWVRERQNVLNDYTAFKTKKAKHVLKKIRIRADSESVPTVSESGLTYMRLLKAQETSE